MRRECGVPGCGKPAYARGVCNAHYARALRAWQRTGAGSLQPDATGTVRRVRALVAVGWRLSDISAAIGVTAPSLSRLVNGKQRSVSVRVARAVRGLYDRAAWERRRGDGSDRARAWAASNGWRSAMWWDDIDNDQEAAA